jgi:hypothetical protein
MKTKIKQTMKADNTRHEYAEKYNGTEGETLVMVHGSIHISEAMLKTLGACVGDELQISEEDNCIYLRKA